MQHTQETFQFFSKNNDMRQIPEQRGMTGLLDSVDFEINDSAVEHIPFFIKEIFILFLLHFLPDGHMLFMRIEQPVCLSKRTVYRMHCF